CAVLCRRRVTGVCHRLDGEESRWSARSRLVAIAGGASPVGRTCVVVLCREACVAGESVVCLPALANRCQGLFAMAPPGGGSSGSDRLLVWTPPLGPGAIRRVLLLRRDAVPGAWVPRHLPNALFIRRRSLSISRQRGLAGPFGGRGRGLACANGSGPPRRGRNHW